MGRGIQSTAICLAPMGTGVSSTGVNKGEEEGRIMDGNALTASKRGIPSKESLVPALAKRRGIESDEAVTEAVFELEEDDAVEVEFEVEGEPALELKIERNADLDTGE